MVFSNDRYISLSFFRPFFLSFVQRFFLVFPLKMQPNKLYACAIAAMSLISYMCLITLVRSHFLFCILTLCAKMANMFTKQKLHSHLVNNHIPNL